VCSVCLAAVVVRALSLAMLVQPCLVATLSADRQRREGRGHP
jgi:hypothetical protein